MKPDYDRAAIAAMQMLIDSQITETGVSNAGVILIQERLTTAHDQRHAHK